MRSRRARILLHILDINCHKASTATTWLLTKVSAISTTIPSHKLEELERLRSLLACPARLDTRPMGFTSLHHDRGHDRGRTTVAVKTHSKESNRVDGSPSAAQANCSKAIFNELERLWKALPTKSSRPSADGLQEGVGCDSAGPRWPSRRPRLARTSS